MKSLLQIFEENNLLDSPETENLINKINELIKNDANTTTQKENRDSRSEGARTRTKDKRHTYSLVRSKRTHANSKRKEVAI